MLICSWFSCFALVKAADWNRFLPWESHQASAERENSVLLLWQESEQMSTFSLCLSPCLLITGENHRLLFPRRFSYVGTKAHITLMRWGGGRWWADKARPVVLWPCWPDFICLCWLGRLPVGSSSNGAAELLLPCCEGQPGSLICCPPGLQLSFLFSALRSLRLSPVCWVSWRWPAEQSVCYLGSVLLPVFDGVTACHRGCSTIWCKPSWLIVELWGEKIPIKVFLSFIHSFLLLFKAENQSAVHTHVHYSLLFPSICLFSSQWSFRLDMHCENVSCSASFFFSFFHSLSLSTVCH